MNPPPQDREPPDELEAYQPAARAHDRRHDRAQLRREDAQRLYPPRQGLHSLPRPLAGYGNSRGSAPLPAASDAERRAAAEHQLGGGGAAFLLYRDPRPPRYGTTP